ncbi:MAG TPA: hypothetical protein P5275_19670 [Saprospiraceae bacterium]|nr:hypothetical protein [Saprospiraceae bacterium]HPG08129.1 hypothetical protein [Saprospiraceae bacterium]HQU54906.1 hypothetical protein [Saprospiraceae bacterium]HRV87103.1 hypothetical protein [Saprospiraceae bacterium]
MTRTRWILMAGVAMTLAACGPSLRPFTEDFYQTYDFKEGDLKKIQFYNSRDIVLYRTAQGGNVEIREGAVKVVDGKKREEIVIPRGTPGVLVMMPKEDRFAISFDAKDSERYLMFGPNPKYGEHYTLLASDWKKYQGVITYGGEKYYTDNTSALAQLMFDVKELRRIENKTYVAKGRTVE